MKHLTLLKARRRAGLTQDELATQSGVTQGAISSLESGQSLNPSYETVRKLEAVLLRRGERLVFGEHACEVSK